MMQFAGQALLTLERIGTGSRKNVSFSVVDTVAGGIVCVSVYVSFWKTVVSALSCAKTDCAQSSEHVEQVWLVVYLLGMFVYTNQHMFLTPFKGGLSPLSPVSLENS